MDTNEIKLFKTYKYENAFKDVFYIRETYNLNEIKIEEDNFRKINLDVLNDFFEN